MTRPEVAKMLAYMQALWQNHRLPKDPAELEMVVVAWHDMLGDLEPAKVLGALREHAATATFPPSIGEIRRLATKVCQLDFDEAWGEIMGQIRSVGRYGSPKFTHYEVKETARALGWENLCNTLEEDLHVVRAQARGFYESACSRESRGANLATLPASRVGLVTAGDALSRALNEPEG